MPVRDVLGVGVDVAQVAAHARAVAVDDARHERHLDAGRGEGHDGERPQFARRSAIDDLAEVGGEARGAGVAAVEEACAARRALVGDEVGIAVVEHEVVDERDAGGGLSHAPTVVSRWPRPPSSTSHAGRRVGRPSVVTHPWTVTPGGACRRRVPSASSTVTRYAIWNVVRVTAASRSRTSIEIVEAQRLAIADERLEHRRLQTVVAPLGERVTDVAQVLDTGLLEVGEVVAVVDDAHRVGLDEPHPDAVDEVVVGRRRGRIDREAHGADRIDRPPRPRVARDTGRSMTPAVRAARSAGHRVLDPRVRPRRRAEGLRSRGGRGARPAVRPGLQDAGRRGRPRSRGRGAARQLSCCR